MKTKRGYITITLAMAIGSALMVGVATFFTTTNATDKSISKVSERISVVETQVSSILSGQVRMEENINTITNFLINKEI